MKSENLSQYREKLEGAREILAHANIISNCAMNFSCKVIEKYESIEYPEKKSIETKAALEKIEEKMVQIDNAFRIVNETLNRFVI